MEIYSMLEEGCRAFSDLFAQKFVAESAQLWLYHGGLKPPKG
jgi:hypothetical protein